jgi:hypothetical protein
MTDILFPVHTSVKPHPFSWRCGYLAVAFATTFDPQEGNKIIFSYPTTIEKEALAGLEFTSLPSGSHQIQQDYVLFRFHHLWGITCFNQSLDHRLSLSCISLFGVFFIFCFFFG